MIKTEDLVINGKAFIKTFSSLGYMVEREGVQYDVAFDPAELNREYTETNIPIEGYTDEATEADYIAALEKLGVYAYA